MKLRIRPRMLTGFMIMIGLLIVLCILAILYTNRLQDNTLRILDENVSSLKAAEELEIALLDMKGFTAYHILDGNSKWLALFEENKSAFKGWLAEARQKAHTSEERQILDSIEQLFHVYLAHHSRVVALYNERKRGDAYRLLTGEMRDTFSLIYEKCEEILALNEKLMYDSSMIMEAENRTVNRIMYGLGLAGIILGLGLGLVLSRSITHPIYELVLKVKSATAGELIEKVDITPETELEHLDKYVHHLIEKVHETNQDLERSRELLQRSEKLAALGKVASGLAHEIRNPLTAIKMLIYSLQKEIKEGPNTGKDFEIIYNEIDRMEAFLQNFLDFARPPNPNYVQLNIDESIHQTLTLLAPQIRSSKVELSHDINTEGIKVFADKEQLQQVFVNIILNALQVMTDGGTLRISTEIVIDASKMPNRLQIKFTDSGSGIPSELLPTIFDPFITGHLDGTGLGLSIAHRIINNHGGWIDAVNNPDRGATFTISLPVSRG